MKRELTVAVAGAAILIAGISGCSSNKSTTSGGPTLTIDGKNQNVTGTVECTSMAGNTTIAIGGLGTGISAVVSSDNPPQVISVALGNVNGVMLAYEVGSGQGNASATKNGNSYKITGTASGMDITQGQTVNKQFELDVTCP